MGKSKQIQNYSPPVLEQVAGDDVGRLFELVGTRLSLGRNEDNDIVLSSEAVSRHHAEIEQAEDGRVWIRDNQSKNGVQVNGEAVQEKELVTGDVIQVGNFIFRYGGPEQKDLKGSPPSEGQALEAWEGAGELTATRYKARGGNRRLLIYGTVGLVVAAVVYISQQPEKTLEKKVGSEVSQAIEKPPVATGLDAPESKDKPGEAPSLGTARPAPKVSGLEDPTLSKAEQELKQLDLNNSPLKESEQYFRKGLREYENKNYNRAIEAFQASLSLYREHPLAGDYLRLVVYEAETEAKRNMEIAAKYFESLQYARAMYHFNQVIDLMAHRPNDPMVALAGKYLELCKKRLQASEMFP